MLIVYTIKLVPQDPAEDAAVAMASLRSVMAWLMREHALPPGQVRWLIDSHLPVVDTEAVSVVGCDPPINVAVAAAAGEEVPQDGKSGSGEAGSAEGDG